MKMKKFMTTTKTPAAVAGSSPTPPPTFSFAVMLQQQGAARNGSPASGERTEDIAGGRLSATPAAIQPVTPLDGSAATAPSKEARTTKGSSLGRLPTTAKDTSTFTTSSTPSSTGAVKMCGYLKKKRNKMGGWRKLFFILQNQLLLSYSSRDDYEKRLAPFKDIINLVPGTIIIPTTGPRFTIETNSKLMYTFRCDDHRSCSEWIMALLDSLTVANGGLSTDRNFSLHNSFHRSTLRLTSFSLPSNCKPFAGVIGRSSGPALGLLKKRAPQPLLECSGPPKPPRCFQPEMAGRSPSASYLSVAHESNDEDDLNNNVLSGNLLQDGKCLATNSLSKSRDNGPKLFGSGDDGDSRQPETVPVESSAPHGSGGKDSYPDQSKGDRFKGVDEDDGILAASGEQEGEKKQKKEDEEEKEEEEEDEEQERAARPRQQIFRLHQDVWSKAHRQSMDVCRINSMFNERQPALIASVPSTIDGMCSSARQTSNSLLQENKTTGASLHAVTPSCDLHLYEDVGVQCPLMVPEPIYAVVDVRAKRSRRLARTLNTATPDGSVERADGGNRKVSVSLPQISDGVELVTVTERRPVTARSCSNYDDYEDVNYLFVGHLRSTGGTETDSVGTDGSREQLPTRHESYGEEHIYEPILVAERIPSVTTGSSSSLPAPATDHQHSHSLWRHLKRMHLQGSWRRLTHRNTGCPKPEEPHTRSTTATALEGLGRRLDSHRRSIKKRIKNLCERIDPVTSTSANGASGGTTTQLLEEGCDDHPKAEPVPETSTGVASRKSVSLDSFLLAKGQQSSVPRC